MKKIIVALLLSFPVCLFAQFGVKAGLNFAKISRASDINSNSQSGFNVGLFLAPVSKKILGSRTELLFSRQGYNYKTSTNTGNVNLDYITLAQYMCINITRFVQLQLGAQTAVLVSATVDSAGNSGDKNSIMDLYNRFDFGYGVGMEVHPITPLIIGARYNVSLTNLYSDIQNFQMPSFTSADAKNNVIQIYAGWRFGGKKKEKSQD